MAFGRRAFVGGRSSFLLSLGYHFINYEPLANDRPVIIDSSSFYFLQSFCRPASVLAAWARTLM